MSTVRGVKNKNPKSQSQKIRSRIYIIAKLRGILPEEQEQYYKEITDWFIRRLDKEIDKLESGLG